MKLSLDLLTKVMDTVKMCRVMFFVSLEGDSSLFDRQLVKLEFFHSVGGKLSATRLVFLSPVLRKKENDTRIAVQR